MISSKEKILLTGITGHLGSHIAKIILEEDQFELRALVRKSAININRLNEFYKVVPESESRIELVEGDLTDFESLKRAVEGVQYIIHTAHPMIFISYAPEIVEIVVKSMQVLLQAAKEQKVKKFILTSSVTCMLGSVWKGEVTYTEEDFAPISEFEGLPYNKSKLIQERMALNFAKQNPQIETIILCPPSMFGPSIYKELHYNNLMQVKLVNGTYKYFPKVWYKEFVDVRDVAVAHYRALLAKNLNGERIYTGTDTVSLSEAIKELQLNFPDSGFSFPKMVLPKIVTTIAGLFSSEVRYYSRKQFKEYHISNQKSKQLLGMTYRDTAKCRVELLKHLIEQGLLKVKTNERPKL